MEGLPPLPPSTSNFVEYTSLKDIMPWQISSNSYSYQRGEISIKDPLLQHAAWAYLMPTATSSHVNDHSRRGSRSNVLLNKLKDKCQICLFDCFGGFFDDVVWSKVGKLFAKGAANDKDDGHDDDHDRMQEEYHDDKVEI